MSKNNDLFANLFDCLLSSDFLMKFLDTFNSEKVSVKSEGNTVIVDVDADISDEDCNGLVEFLLKIISMQYDGVEDMNDYFMKITVGNRPTYVYEYKHEKGEFELVGGESSDKNAPENDKSLMKASGVKCEVKENEGVPVIDEMPFAKWLKTNLEEDIENGEYESEIFDVDEAIDRILSIYETDSYDIITDSNGKLIGIKVPITELNDIIEPSEEIIDSIMEKEGCKIAEFVRRCIFDLGFSNVIPETSEDNTVSSTVEVSKYKDILFNLYF